jgi:hypothetical protein
VNVRESYGAAAARALSIRRKSATVSLGLREFDGERFGGGVN